MIKINLQEVKQALGDPEFRKKLPAVLKEDVQKYEQNPNCACNMSVYRNVLRYGATQLKEYYPNKNIPAPESFDKLTENHWSVINCNISDLESHLKALPPGQKQLAIARFEDQVTVVVNELGF